ncbi:hypothetical protein K439DRAFT_1612892 [Ramaria rubella]|nr:hypothetical protein K439DRAFT_1612892 [Ramaria rubella]
MEASIMIELENEKYSKLLEDEFEDLTPMQRNSHITHMDPTALTDCFDIFHTLKPSIMAFTRKATGEIATFKLRGYIARKKLPPIYANTKPLWASQFVTKSLYQAFASRVGEDNVQKFSVGQFAGYPSLNFARHYFSGITDGTSEPLPKEIDPSGRLAKLGKNMHYSEENRVVYLKKNVYAGIRSNVEPSVFQTSALVEVTFTVTTKLRKNTWKVYHDLNKIVLLNDDVVKWYQARKLDEIVKLPLQLSSVSSKRGCEKAHGEDHEIGQARKKLKELDISMVDGTQCSPEGDMCSKKEKRKKKERKKREKREKKETQSNILRGKLIVQNTKDYPWRMDVSEWIYSYR